MTFVPTPSQTVGPFFSLGLLHQPWNVLVPPDADDRIRIEGRVLYGDGDPLPDAMLEIWHAGRDGRYPDQSRPGFPGFGRAGTDEEGRYWFETEKPGAVGGSGNPQAPHINVHVFARGLLDNLTTRIYFSDEASNDIDPVLRSAPEERRRTLIAEREERGSGALYRFDIVLQGDNETVFFDA
jgi:protocatechuate 3,4-dioxygenase, alpha subunit